MDGHPTHPRRWGGLFLVLLLLAAGAGAWRLWQVGQGPEFRLPDGTAVRVRQVTSGSEHFSPFDPLTHRMVALLPAGLRKRFPASMRSPAYGRPGSSLACWFEFDRVPDVIRTNGGMGGGSALHVTLHDGRAFRIRSDQDYGGQVRNGGYFEAHLFPAPLRADRPLTFEVHFKPDRWSEPRGDVAPDVAWQERVRLPEPPAVPDGGSIPATRVVGDLRVVLTNLSVGVHRNPPSPGRSGPLDTWAFAGLSLEDTSGKGVHWEVMGLRAHSDVSGTTTHRVSWIHEQGRMWWWHHLWPDQPWTLAFEVGRTNGFHAGELAGFTGLDPAGFSPVSKSLETGTLTLKSLVRRQWGESEAIELRVEVDPKQEPARLRLVRAVDAGGNPLGTQGTSWSSREATFHLDVPTTPTLDVTLALQMTREVEFVVRPTVPPE